jgi:hypothetical protein
MGFAHGAPSHGCARARGSDASHAPAAPRRAQTNGGDEREGSAAERRAQRRERRRRARLERFAAENAVFAESRRLLMALEDPAAAPLGPSVDDLARWAAEVGYSRRLR